VTQKSLLGKSDDIERSHGFFIKVRDRLVNEGDPLFGLTPLYHGTFNRFRADIRADDLDDSLKASRENIEESKLKEIFRGILRELFNEANSRYSEYLRKIENSEIPKREGDKQIVAPRLVEYPLADAILFQTGSVGGPEADESWFYLQLEPGVDTGLLTQALYNGPRNKYKYEYVNNGPTSRLVRFDPFTLTFKLNANHTLVQAYAGEGLARVLLEDIVTAEAMLEVYLRTSAVPPHVVGVILEQRDSLLRSLTRDHLFSPTAIGRALRDAAANEHDLEEALVIAARTIGFVATHIAGSGEPDGIARFTDYPDGEKKITLEAKSSEKVPSLGAIDFAGLMEHVKQHGAHGCLLVAPAYPGSSREKDSAAANRAKELRISCWTVDQLARFVDSSEVRQLNAKHLLDIVLTRFTPNEVAEALEHLFREPKWDNRDLYHAILNALVQLDGKLADRARTVEMIATKVSDMANFSDVKTSEVETAVRELANASQGGMTLRDNSTLLIHVSLDELDRRLSGMTKIAGEPRRLSNFRREANT
jgi:hypothetical protein